MNYQNIFAEVSTADLQVIKDALATIRQKLPFLVNLTKTERQQLYKTGESRLSFVQNAKAVAQNNPGILPAIFDVGQFASDVNLFAVLTELTTLFKQLVSQSDDTRLAVGAASLAGASQVYKYVQIGVKTTPGLKPLADQLGKAFKRSSQKAPPPPAKQTQNDAVAPKPLILEDRSVTGDARSVTGDSRRMTADGRSMTDDAHAMTVDAQSMAVDAQSMAVDARSMTVDALGFIRDAWGTWND